jgi:hypothetical protein
MASTVISSPRNKSAQEPAVKSVRFSVKNFIPLVSLGLGGVSRTCVRQWVCWIYRQLQMPEATGRCSLEWRWLVSQHAEAAWSGAIASESTGCSLVLLPEAIAYSVPINVSITHCT